MMTVTWFQIDLDRNHQSRSARWSTVNELCLSPTRPVPSGACAAGSRVPSVDLSGDLSGVPIGRDAGCRVSRVRRLAVLKTPRRSRAIPSASLKPGAFLRVLGVGDNLVRIDDDVTWTQIDDDVPGLRSTTMSPGSRSMTKSPGSRSIQPQSSTPNLHIGRSTNHPSSRRCSRDAGFRATAGISAVI